MSRTVLAACEGSYRAPWQSVRGDEIGLRVVGLGPDERIDVFFDHASGDYISIEHNGEVSIDFVKRNRYQICKHAPQPTGHMTTVEVLVREEAAP